MSLFQKYFILLIAMETKESVCLIVQDTNLKKPNAVIRGGTPLDDQYPILIYKHSRMALTCFGFCSQHGRDHPANTTRNQWSQLKTEHPNAATPYLELKTHHSPVELSNIRVDNANPSCASPIAYWWKTETYDH